MRKGKFDLDDLADQLAQVEKIGGLGGIMGMLPGVAKMKDQIASANLDDKVIKRQRAIILSMTPEERRNPDILKASRKKRIAAGSGTKVEEVNRLLEAASADGRHDEADGRRNKRGGRWARWPQMFGLGGGMPRRPDEHRRHAGADGPGGKAPALRARRPKRRPFPHAFRPSRREPARGLARCLAAAETSRGGLPGLGGGKLPGLGGGIPAEEEMNGLSRHCRIKARAHDAR